MGSDWIKCTLQAGKDKAIWINLAAAMSIVEHKGGSRVAFRVGEDDETIDVKEDPETLLGLEEEEEEEGEAKEDGDEGEKDEDAEQSDEKTPTTRSKT
jgi:stringent starvation protein B